MRSLTRTMTAAAAMTLILGAGGPASAQADTAEGYGDGYASGAFGRVRFAEGGATIVRADGEDGQPDNAGVNAPLFPGDAVRTDGGQRVEIQLAGGTIVRIDRSGEVVFQSLPNPAAKYRDNTVLALNAGAVRITSRLDDKDEFRIDTRAASVYLLGEGEFRIESEDRGVTQVASRRGVAEVVGNDASVLVRGGMRTAAVAGAVPESPRAFSAFASDGFDRWCDSRDDAYRAKDPHAGNDDEIVVPSEVRPYEAELSSYGTWRIVPDYGRVWYPNGVSYGWRPYNHGYWAYGPGGYFWVSYEPWGWAPYHYGNWQWTGYGGWGWVPGRVFAGAWVSWSWGAAYVGWAPLDFWGRPGWVGGPYYAGYYDPGCWTFVGYENLSAHNVHRYAVPIDRVRDDLRHAKVVARGPRVDPRRVAESPVWRERALRQVADDRAAHLSPTEGNRYPERRLSDVQDQLLRRSAAHKVPTARALQDNSAAQSLDRRVIAPRSRRILDDPRSGSQPSLRPETRDDVRQLYQRMSRPRETRGPEITAPRGSDASVGTPPSRGERPRAQVAPAPAPGPQAPRAQAPRAQAPRAQAPQTQPPQAKARQNPQAAPKAKPNRGDKH